MLYKIAHILRDKLSWLWNIIEWMNGVIFYMRYGKRLRAFSFSVVPEGYEIVPIRDIPTDGMVEFFARQPEEAFMYFKPHGFDTGSIKMLQRNKAFLGYVLCDRLNGQIAGYCFNRCFFHGQGFRGRMVDINYRGKGLGTAMNKILNEVGFGIGLRLFETVSKDNIPSYRSAMSASNVKVVKEMPHNELYLEILKG
ncbi:hypothetical protein SAMN05216462_2475 [Xylanibacter ruminicola]|uniref:N-acetyltransferase domain-containing protein n=1 Tax=Xylanibacter ruminicola TaxID=839 RepID=A0A1H4DQH8_XYLRU|nr:GNAT family N-acetyltransferase [Xylanibacter ruminicola]SEA75001.1 hypothetical protein SAMN05216462_2475 [Xylanibacter ruminicola]